MKRFKRIFLWTALVLIIANIGAYFYFKKQFAAPPVTLAPVGNEHTIAFRWLADTVNSQPDPFAAIILPVTLSGCPRTFYMQFDLGAPYSMFYANKLQAIRSKYHLPAAWLHKEKNSLANISFTIDKMPVYATSIRINQYDNTGIDWADSTAVEIIGTIGSDMLEDRILIVNYPARSLTLAQNRPDALADVPMEPFQWKERKILLPAVVGNEPTTLYFDTGSSAFELLTNEETWNRLARKNETPDQYTVNSWDKKLTAFTVPTDQSVTLASVSFPLRNVTRIEGTSLLQNMLMRFSGIGGMTGNRLFVNSILIIDTRHQQFAILKKKDQPGL